MEERVVTELVLDQIDAAILQALKIDFPMPVAFSVIADRALDYCHISPHGVLERLTSYLEFSKHAVQQEEGNEWRLTNLGQSVLHQYEVDKGLPQAVS
jgi:hypothetical protein